MVFSCPCCGVPYAEATEEVDIHSGAGYVCSECGGTVIFEAFTTEEYQGYCKYLKEEYERRAAREASQPR